MDQVTQQNAALVEEAAAAAGSLQEQAGSLVQAVSVFRLGAGTGVRGEPSFARVSAVATAAPKARAKAVEQKTASTPQLAAAGDWAEF